MRSEKIVLQPARYINCKPENYGIVKIYVLKIVEWKTDKCKIVRYFFPSKIFYNSEIFKCYAIFPFAMCANNRKSVELHAMQYIIEARRIEYLYMFITLMVFSKQTVRTAIHTFLGIMLLIALLCSSNRNILYRHGIFRIK